MDEEVTTQFWISFFVEAGIPPAAAANYAIIFTENRIQKHMLLDLNKEYLKDMGVNILGDIIAILKHAKSHHEKVAREKVLAGDKEISVKKATKHLNEILSKEEPVKATPDPVQQPAKPAPQPAQNPSPPKKMKIVKTETSRIIEEEAWYAKVEELKRKVIPPSKLAPAVPVTAAKKSSVFERLGEGSVTSTTPDTPATSLKSSVFKRLGNVSLQEASVPKAVPATTSSVKVVTRKPLETTPAVTKPVRITLEAKKPSMRMDSVTPSTKKSAKERLGLDHNPSPSRTVTQQPTQIFTQKTISNRIVKRPVTESQPRSSNSNGSVKQRLGVNSVFDRLGINRKNVI